MPIACFAPFWLTPGTWGANTTTISVSLALAPASVSGVSNSALTSGSVSIPTNFTYYFQGLQTATTGSKTALSVGNVTPLRFCLLHNTDDYNYVSIYSDSTGSSEFVRLLPGDWALVPLAPSATPYIQANNNNVSIQIYLTAA